MRQKDSANLWRRFLGSRLLLVLEVGMIILFIVALSKEMVRRWEIRQDIRTLEQEIAELREQNAELSGLITYFQSDYYKEREARLKLGLQKEGESALSLPIPNSGSLNQAENKLAVNSAEGPLALPQKWWNYFFAKK